ncbi:hypothetical protein [Kribbella antiqua]|uniref:hypothetical protein n=1 Tax=Kribbella antiqua TaxID=2512217 RepID=UPI0018EE948E|nr:hypothetical protein [Kribbella antiqua]
MHLVVARVSPAPPRDHPERVRQIAVRPGETLVRRRAELPRKRVRVHPQHLSHLPMHHVTLGVATGHKGAEQVQDESSAHVRAPAGGVRTAC